MSFEESLSECGWLVLHFQFKEMLMCAGPASMKKKTKSLANWVLRSKATNSQTPEKLKSVCNRRRSSPTELAFSEGFKDDELKP